MRPKKPGLDDRLYKFEIDIMNGGVDDMTAVQTLDSLISEDPKSINPRSYARWLERTKLDKLTEVVHTLKQIGRLQKKINLFKKISKSFTKKGGNK